MSDQERHEHNAKYHGITIEQARELERLWHSPMKSWPDSLKATVKDHCDRYMACSEVILGGIAAWLKTEAK